MRYFITGTDTGVGKTIAAAALTLATAGIYWKPLQSGIAVEVADSEEVQRLTQLPPKHFLPTCYNLKAPLTPSQAAQLENVTIDLNKCLLTNFPKDQALFIEGAGGLYAPLTQNACNIDYIAMLKASVILVCRGTLGTINHTLLSIKALEQRGIPIKGIIFSGDLFSPNQSDIERLSNVKTLFHIPTFAELNSATFQTWLAANKADILQSLAMHLLCSI